MLMRIPPCNRIFPLRCYSSPAWCDPLFPAMPTYEYLCPKCEKTFEVFQSMNDKHLTKCPDNACKGRVKRLLGTGAGLIFKGSGFYITDYRSEGYKSSAKSDSAAASSASSAPAAPAAAGSASDSGASTKKESKPATTSSSETKPAAKPKKGGD